MEPTEFAATKRMGRPPKITRDEILDAAERNDPANLQLTKLAEELGISVKTIYYYFSGRQALIDGVTERVIADMGLPDIGRSQTWQAVMREVALWHSHIAALKSGWLNDPDAPLGIKKVVVDVIRLTCHKLGEFGWTLHDAYRAYVVVGNWATSHGEANRVSCTNGDYSPGKIDEVLREFGDASLEDLGRIMHPFESQEDIFEDALRILLAGIEAVVVAGAAGGAQQTKGSRGE